MAHRSEQQATLVELFTEILCAFLFYDVLSVSLPVSKELFGSLNSVPLVHPAVNYCIVAISLVQHFSDNGFLFSKDGIEFAKFGSFLALEFFDSLSENGGVSLFECLNFFHDGLLKVDVACLDMLAKLLDSHLHGFDCVHD